ncbi:MAG: hypothetical protein M1588_03440 [Planctomycetes bacterium]|nr:hypothetical protein [Planctomycetota bacterium]
MPSDQSEPSILDLIENYPEEQSKPSTLDLIGNYLENVNGARRLYQYPERADRFFQRECRVDAETAKEIEHGANVEAAQAMLGYAARALTALKDAGLPETLSRRCDRAMLALCDTTDVEWADTASKLEGWAVDGQAAAKMKNTKVSKSEANVALRKLLRKKYDTTVREAAKQIGCSTGLVAQLPAWRAVQEKRREQHLPKSAKTIKLTDKMTEIVAAPAPETSLQAGNQTSNSEQVRELIEQQQRDAMRDANIPRRTRVRRTF